MPLGGYSLPIVIDLFNCFPLNDLKITPTLSSNTLVFDTTFQFDTISSTSIDSRIIFVVQHPATETSLQSGDILTMNFTLSGTNKDSFTAPLDIELVMINSKSGLFLKEPEAVLFDSERNPITVADNRAELNLRCDQSA